MHGKETVLDGDQAYWKQSDREAFEAQGVRYRVNRRGPRGNKSLTEPNAGSTEPVHGRERDVSIRSGS
jgi:hypothetical protein